MADKTDFKTSVTKDKGAHFIMIKEFIQQENLITCNIYSLSRVSKYIKQKLIVEEEEMDKS